MAKNKPTGGGQTGPAAPDVRKAARKKAKELRDTARKLEAAAGGKYETHREKMAVRAREQSAGDREIGPLLPDARLDVKEAARLCLRTFCESYLPGRFSMTWSADHLKVIAKLQAAVLDGGLFALAMPRGSGKTSLAEAAALWAILYGHRRFVVLIGATDEAACEMLDSVKLAVETNDLLFDSFHAACQPVRELEGINNRASGQTLGGERTRISWTANEVVFPTVAGAPSSGARIRVAGITGRIRGMKAATADGDTIRPDFAIADDPQTDTTAVSLLEIGKREKRLRGAVKGLAGPGKTISMVVPCTVIAEGDLSDRLLNRDRNPQFQGERMRMVYSFPTNQELWDRYKELREASLKADRKGEEATEFYRANRAAMDEGAVVAWPERFNPETELSGVQAAMNLLIDNPAEFWSEYQNDPRPDAEAADERTLDPGQVAARLSKTPRCTVPRACTRLTAFIDCGKGLLWYAVCAWDERFNGTVIDYGAYPKQNRPDFYKTDPRPALAEKHPNLSDDQMVYAGLTVLADQILGRTYPRQDTGEEMPVHRCLVDSSYFPDTVYLFARKGRHLGVVLPFRGVGEKAGRLPMNAWPRKDNETPGHNWRIGPAEGGRGRVCKANVDYWKGFAYDRLTTAPGGAGHLDLFGDRAHEHAMLARHCTAERGFPVELPTDGRKFEKWDQRPNCDNDLWDCLVGNCVAASLLGLKWAADVGGEAAAPRPAKKKMKLSDLYYAKHGR